MITVYQNPLVLTPTNTEHVYNVGSSNSGNTSFKYLVDVYMDVDSTPNRVARLKVQPNSTGVGIFDLQEIVVNYVFPNPRSENPQTYQFTTGGNFTTASTINGIIVNNARRTKGFSNGFVGNDNTDSLYHIRQYRAMVGEEWITGGTEYQQISTASTVPCSSFYVDIDLEDNSVNIYNAGANIVGISPYSPGYNYYIYNNSLVFQSSGTSSNINANILGGAYTTGWYLYVQEIYTGIQYQFLQGAGGYWGKTLISYPGDTSSYLSPCPVTIFPGTDSNKVDFDYSYDKINEYWSGSTNGITNHLYNKAFDYQFTGSTYISSQMPAQFLTTFGDDLGSINLLGASTNNVVSNRVRHRHHHIDCPFLLSYFNGNVGLFTNPVRGMDVLYQTKEGNITVSSQMRISGSLVPVPANPTPLNQRISYFNIQVGEISSNNPTSVYLFVGSGTAITTNYSGNGISEVVRLDIVDDCLSDPLHFMFLSENGVWDTFSFDKRNIKSYNRQISQYATGGIKNKSWYNRLGNEQRNVIYDYDVTEVVTAQSWLMDENDKKIVEELFLSDYVYLIEKNEVVENQIRSPYLIPITITSTSLESFKQRYNKLFQYTLNFEYNPIKTYRTSL